MGDLLFRRQRLFLFIKFSILWPLSFVSLLPHIWLWLLKSTMSMKGLGSCCIKFLSSSSIILLLGGMYSEHMLIVLCFIVFDVPLNDFIWFVSLFGFHCNSL